MYIERNAEKRVLELNKFYKIVLVTGPRQIGKTTMLKKIKEKDRNYISLDELEIRRLAIDDPKLFLQKYQPPIIIDEIQYAPDLLSYIKRIVDESDEKGLYWLTGSQQFQLMKNVSESLAGRVGIVNMYSLSTAEKTGITNKVFEPENPENLFDLDVNKLFDDIFKGGMPDYCINNIPREDFFNNYITTYLERDVRDLTQVGDLNTFYKFLISIAARTGEVLNYNNIAEDVGISPNTVKNWVSILEASGIIYLLQQYSNVELKRAIKNPKIYFLDTGLCAYLCKWSNKDVLESSSVSGHYLETYVISELVKNYKCNSTNIGIYYYRDKDDKEIDLILYKDETLYPFEIKKSSKPNKEMLKNFYVLNSTKKKIGKGGVICLYPDIIPLNENNNSIPISCIL